MTTAAPFKRTLGKMLLELLVGFIVALLVVGLGFYARRRGSTLRAVALAQFQATVVVPGANIALDSPSRCIKLDLSGRPVSSVGVCT